MEEGVEVEAWSMLLQGIRPTWNINKKISELLQLVRTSHQWYFHTPHCGMRRRKKKKNRIKHRTGEYTPYRGGGSSPEQKQLHKIIRNPPSCSRLHLFHCTDWPLILQVNSRVCLFGPESCLDLFKLTDDTRDSTRDYFLRSSSSTAKAI